MTRAAPMGQALDISAGRPAADAVQQGRASRARPPRFRRWPAWPILGAAAFAALLGIASVVLDMRWTARLAPTPALAIDVHSGLLEVSRVTATDHVSAAGAASEKLIIRPASGRLKWWFNWQHFGGRQSLAIPLWVPVSLLAWPTVIAWKRAFHAAPGQCRKGRYDLSGLRSDRCPECGRPIPRARPRRRQRGLALLCAAALGSVVLVLVPPLARNSSSRSAILTLDLSGSAAAAKGWPAPSPEPWPSVTSWSVASEPGYRQALAWSNLASRRSPHKMQVEEYGWPLRTFRRVRLWWPEDGSAIARGFRSDSRLTPRWPGLILNPALYILLAAMPVGLIRVARGRIRLRGSRQAQAAGGPE